MTHLNPVPNVKCMVHFMAVCRQFFIKFSKKGHQFVIKHAGLNHLIISFMVVLLSVVSVSGVSLSSTTMFFKRVLAAYGSMAALDFT